MPLLPQQFGRREGGSIQLRSDALRLVWTFDDLPSVDSHALRVRFSCSGQIANTEPDRRMFRELFLAESSVAGVAEVCAHFAAALRTAAARASQALTAEQAVGEESGGIKSALVNACKPVAFACGLEILPPFSIEVSSPSFERERIELMHRAQAEQRVAGQVQHFQRAKELLKQFQALRAEMPNLSPGELLAQVNSADRGRTLHSLLVASARKAEQSMLWAVAGPHLVRIDGSQNPPRCELISLPATGGPLRSIQPGTIHGRRLLLIGARNGAMVVPPESPAEVQIYLDPTVRTQLGFNRVVARGEEVWASHGEAGVVGWKLGQTSEPFARFCSNRDGAEEPASTPDANLPNPVASVGASPSLIAAGSRSARPAGPRNIQVLDADHLVWSVGSNLFILDEGDPHTLPGESTSEILAILPDDRRMLVVHGDSTISVLDRDSRQIIDRQKRAGRVCAAGALPWLGGVRMLLVDSDGPIDCVCFDDPLITQYTSTHRGLRVVTASADLVAALSSDRQRILLWQTWDGRSPVAEIHITGLARHRVADVEFDSEL